MRRAAPGSPNEGHGGQAGRHAAGPVPQPGHHQWSSTPRCPAVRARRRCRERTAPVVPGPGQCPSRSPTKPTADGEQRYPRRAPEVGRSWQRTAVRVGIEDSRQTKKLEAIGGRRGGRRLAAFLRWQMAGRMERAGLPSFGLSLVGGFLLALIEDGADHRSSLPAAAGAPVQPPVRGGEFDDPAGLGLDEVPFCRPG